MDSTGHGWRIFDRELPVLLYRYSFGAGVATSLAVGAGSGLILVSPPCRTKPGVAEDLAQFGPVRALVAPNAFHTLGVAEWHARLPEVPVHAPAQAIARVEKQARIRGIRPVAELAALAGPRVEFVDMPHYKTGEVLLRITLPGGLAWCVTDVILNLPALPPNLFARLAFGLSGSAPGLRYNNIAPLFMVADKAALRRWLAEQYAKAPPRWLIPAHGDVVDFAADPEAAKRLFGTG
jgi:hypothetical protein